MSLVSDIITQAYRETNLIPMGNTPNVNQTAEALSLLNTIVLSAVGNEIGDELLDINIGGAVDETVYTTEYVPANTRLILKSGRAHTFYLDPKPHAGQRLAVADTVDSLAAFNVVINANGRRIEGAPSVTLSTNGETRQWLYRADIGTWVKISALLSGDLFSFPAEFDDYFITSLALRINPRYGQSMSSESVETMKRARRNIRARYRNRKSTLPEYFGVIGENRDGVLDFNRFNRGG